MKLKLTLIVFLLIPIICAGQSNTDSLSAILRNSTGLGRIEILNKLADSQKKSSPSKCIKYATEAYDLSRKLKNKQGEASSLKNLALGFYFSGHFPMSMKYFQNSLEIYKDISDKFNIVDVEYFIGQINEISDDYEQAEKFYYHAFLKLTGKMIADNKLSEDYPCRNLDALYKKTGSKLMPDTLYSKIKNLLLRHLDEKDDINYANSLSGISVELAGLNKNTLAEVFFSEAIRIIRKLKGENSPDYISALNKLGDIYAALGKLEEAEARYLQTINLVRRLRGDNHQDYASALSKLATFYYNHKFFEKAEPLYKKALEIFKVQLSMNVPNYTSSLNNLADLYYTIGRNSDADKLYEEGINLILEPLKKVHPLYKNKIVEMLKNIRQFHEIEIQKEKNLRSIKEREVQSLKINQEINNLKIDRQRSMIIFIVSGALMALVFVVILLKSNFERKKSNILLESANKKLMDSQRDLLIAKESAETANRFNSDFLSEISQQIHSPMNIIIGFGYLLRSQVESSKGKEYLASVISGGKQLLSMINDMIYLSKIETGNSAVELKPVNIKTLAYETRATFAQTVESKDIAFGLVLDETLPEFLMLDEIRLRHILINLVSNAVKNTESGSVKLSISRNKTHEDNSIDLKIEVKDTGKGFSKEQTKMITNAFHQHADTGAGSLGAIGLGLSLTKSLVDALDGTISIDSEFGAGSNFRIHLRKINPAKALTDGKLSIDDNPDEIVRFANTILLIIDNNEQNSRLIIEYLADTDINVIEAATGIEALELMKVFKPAVILSEYNILEEDEYETIKIIKTKPEFSSIPLIAQIDRVNPALVEKIVSSGFSSHILKPISRQRLINELKKYIPYE